MVPASEVAAVLELPPNNLQILLDTLAAIYPDLVELNIENVPATLVPVHCLCLFLLAQLYGKRRWPPPRAVLHSAVAEPAALQSGVQR